MYKVEGGGRQSYLGKDVVKNEPLIYFGNYLVYSVKKKVQIVYDSAVTLLGI